MIYEAFEKLLEYMDIQESEYGEMDFPQALEDVAIEFDLSYEQQDEIKELYDNHQF